MARAVLTMADYSGEKTTTTVTSAALTAGNIADQTTDFTALRSAIQALTLGTPQSHSINQITQVSNALPTNPNAQREMKWLVTYSSGTKNFQIEIGTADLGNDHLIPNSDMADLTNEDWQAFITAFEAFAVSPDDGTSAVTVVSAQFVGRRS